MQFIDDAEFQIAIDDDNGARITSLKWRENEFAVPWTGSYIGLVFHGSVGWANQRRFDYK
jgi:aldose 1-epimerase